MVYSSKNPITGEQAPKHSNPRKILVHHRFNTGSRSTSKHKRAPMGTQQLGENLHRRSTIRKTKVTQGGTQVRMSVSTRWYPGAAPRRRSQNTEKKIAREEHKTIEPGHNATGGSTNTQ